MAQMPLCLAVGLRVFLRLSFVCAQLPLFATALVRSSAGGREGPRRHIALQQKEVTKKTEKSMYMQFHMCSLYRGLCPPPTFSLPNILLLGLVQASFQGLARPSRPLLRLPRKRGWLHRSKRRFVRERSFEVNLLQIFESANIAPAFAYNSYLVTSTLAYNTPI